MFVHTAIKYFFTHFSELKEVTSHISTKHPGVSKVQTTTDIVWSSLRYGTNYTEYEALNFCERTGKNKSTYLTVLYWLVWLKKLNPTQYRKTFRDKRLFNEIFKEYTKREWINLSTSNEEQIKRFIDLHSEIVLKKSSGSSGKQVLVMGGGTANVDKVIRIIQTEHFDLMENRIKNIDSIAAYNPTSLNTMRILTIHSSKAFNILMACLRIGAKGNTVDNISCGGSSSLIDLNTGCLSTPFVGNAYRKIATTQEGWVENPLMGDNRKIPYWDETIDMIKNAALKVPEIHVVGWDVAITPEGPVLIEGNESCDTAVMQYYFGPQEPGLKKRFIELVNML